MRIAQISPLFESVPPKLYGGTERVVSWLTEALVRQGHDVTLFATADSRTSARLIPVSRRALRLDPDCQDKIAHHTLMLERVCQEAESTGFDVLHFHIDYLHYPLMRRYGGPHVTTLHGRLDIPDLVPLYREYDEMPVVSISESQRAPLPWLNWRATVYHGMPLDLLDLHQGAGDYVAFLGRFSPEKQPDVAIRMAIAAGVPIKLAAKIEVKDAEYFEAAVRPLLAHPLVEYVGEVNEQQKQDFLGSAIATLFPINWPEPFGLVMIESMAVGTPVIAFRQGSVPEVMREGVSGYVVDSVESGAEAIGKAASLDRRACRAYFEERFSAARMAADYLRIYEELGKTDAQPIDTELITAVS